MASIPAAVLTVLVQANTGGASASLTRLDRRLKGTAAQSNATATAVAGAGKRVGLVLGGIGAASLVAAAKWEQAFADVKKTVDATPKQFKKIEDGLRNMAKQIPVSAEELAHLAGEAGALGVKAKDIVKFTRVAADLGVATDLSANDAANALARLSNIMGTKGKKAFERMGSTLVDLGNKGASTESEITEMALRIAGAGEVIGLTEAQVLGFASALSNVGIRAEAGGSSISRVMLEMQDAVAQGGNELAEFAEIAGMGPKGFAKAFKQDAPAAIQAFVAGLDKIKDSGGSVTAALDDVELNEIRVRDALLRLGGATGEVTTAQKIANKAWGKNNALAEEANKKYKTTASQFEILKNRVFDLGITFGQDLLPELNKVMKRLGKGDLGGAISAMAELGGEMAAKLLGAFAKAWWDSDLLGKLFLTGAFIRLVGGRGVFLALGVGLGKLVGRAFGGKMATTVASKLGAGKLIPPMTAAGWGQAAGIAFGAAFAIAAGVYIEKKWHPVAGLMTKEKGELFGGDVFRVAKLGIKGSLANIKDDSLEIRKSWIENVLKPARQAGQVNAKQFKRLRDAALLTNTTFKRTSTESAQSVATGQKDIRGAVAQTANKTPKSARDAGRGIHRGIGDGVRGAEKDLGRLPNTAKSDLGKTESKTDKGAKEVARALGNPINAMVKAVVGKGGFGALVKSANKALGAFKSKDRISYKPTAPSSAEVAALHKARGGHINIGKPSGDSVPAMLEKDEYVLNRKAAKRIGKARLDAINFGMAPRFQHGGAVGMQAGGLQPGISQLAKWAHQRYGLMVSSGFRPGDSDSFHGSGEAVDLVPPSMGATKGIFGAFKSQLEELFYDPWGGWDSGQMIGAIGGHGDHIHAAISGAGGPVAMARKIARIILKGPKGPTLTTGQSALDQVHSAANSYIAKQMPSGHMGFSVPTGPIQQMAHQMVLQGWGQGEWPPFVSLEMAEAGWDPTAVNPSSGAAGLAQALPPSKYPPGAWPYRGPSSAKLQLQWMMDYIRDRYGSPSGAWAFHQANNYYKEGGAVGMARGGLHLGRHLRDIKNINKPRKRRRELGRLIDKIKGVGLPESEIDRLKGLDRNVQIFDDLATRASDISGDGLSVKVPGPGGTLDQAGWLKKELGALWDLRGAMIKAENKVKKLRSRIKRETSHAQKLLRDLKRDTRRGQHKIDKLRRKRKLSKGDLKDIRKASRKADERIAELEKKREKRKLSKEELQELRHLRKSQTRREAALTDRKLPISEKRKRLLESLHDAQDGRQVRIGVLSDKLIPALGERRSKITESLSNFMALDDIQGIGSPRDLKARLGSPVDRRFGGELLRVQLQLQDLGQSADPLDGLNISDLQEFGRLIKVGAFDTDAFGTIPKFHQGGVFRAPTPGGEGLALLKDRERITPEGNGAGGGDLYLSADIYIGGERVGRVVDQRLEVRDRRERQGQRQGSVLPR